MTFCSCTEQNSISAVLLEKTPVAYKSMLHFQNKNIPRFLRLQQRDHLKYSEWSSPHRDLSKV